jgi:hypothetical protein
MTSSDLILAATAGAVCLALCATLWAMSQRRRFEDHLARLKARAQALETRLMDSQGAAEAFESAVVVIHDRRRRPGVRRGRPGRMRQDPRRRRRRPGRGRRVDRGRSRPRPQAEGPVRTGRGLRLRSAWPARRGAGRGPGGRNPRLAAPGRGRRQRDRPARRRPLRRLHGRPSRAGLDLGRRRRAGLGQRGLSARGRGGDGRRRHARQQVDRPGRRRPGRSRPPRPASFANSSAGYRWTAAAAPCASRPSRWTAAGSGCSAATSPRSRTCATR